MATLHIEVESGKACPYSFTKTDSKLFCRYLLEGHIWRNDGPPDLIGLLAQALNLNLTPLEKVAGQAYSLEEYLSWARNEAE